jgi:hypothetical protein
MSFNEFCVIIAEKMGVRLVPVPTKEEYCHLWVTDVPYEKFCLERQSVMGSEYDIYFRNFNTKEWDEDYICSIYDNKTHNLYGHITWQQRKKFPVYKPASSFYNRDDLKQEVYYDGTSLKRAVDALKKREPYKVW